MKLWPLYGGMASSGYVDVPPALRLHAHATGLLERGGEGARGEVSMMPTYPILTFHQPHVAFSLLLQILLLYVLTHQHTHD